MTELESEPKYKDYLLRNNPFPETATLEPTSGDPRTSGEIFNDKVFAEEIQDLWKRIDSKINVIYVTGGGWERGIGKSALVFNTWKSLRTRENATAVYLRASAKSKPSDFCNRIVANWHKEGYLWQAFKDLLQNYRNCPNPKIPASKIDSLLQTYRDMPDRVHLRAFTFERESKVADGIQKWAHNRVDGMVPEATHVLFETYLTSPGDFMANWSNLKVKGHDDIDFFDSMLKLFDLTKKSHHYFVIDQFEDAVRGNQGKNQLANFCSEMRRIIVACARKATIIVTLHPESEEILEERGGEHLTGLADTDERHKLDIKEITMDEAVDLALSYLEYFRLPNCKPKTGLFPFDAKAIEYVRYTKGGAARDILQALATAIEIGVEAQCSSLDMDFLRKNHRKIFDRVFSEETLEKFRKSVD
jgi:hypothetical protein